MLDILVKPKVGEVKVSDGRHFTTCPTCKEVVPVVKHDNVEVFKGEKGTAYVVLKHNYGLSAVLGLCPGSDQLAKSELNKDENA